MILSASRRTDIPAFYSEWLSERFREGYLLVRNPMNFHQLSRICLNPDVIDCIVFWTKNPLNMLPRLHEFEEYPYYFQFTLTGYGREIEPGLPDKRSVLIPAFQELSRRIGSGRVIWRYDPIFLTGRYTMEYHERAFAEIAGALSGYTGRVVISFLDIYAKTQRNMEKSVSGCVKAPSVQEMNELARKLASLARRFGMQIQTCAEQIDLEKYGIRHGACIDREYIGDLLGCSLKAKKDHGQRLFCGCVESVEAGTYHTCRNGCRYCYANDSAEAVRRMSSRYDIHSPLLCGQVEEGDRITERRMKSLKDLQISLEDL